jgi:hypothetical protein
MLPQIPMKSIIRCFAQLMDESVTWVAVVWSTGVRLRSETWLINVSYTGFPIKLVAGLKRAERKTNDSQTSVKPYLRVSGTPLCDDA